jgi:hypothetical protein
LDLRLQFIVVSKHDGDGKNDGTPAGEIRRQNGCQSEEGIGRQRRIADKNVN